MRPAPKVKRGGLLILDNDGCDNYTAQAKRYHLWAPELDS